MTFALRVAADAWLGVARAKHDAPIAANRRLEWDRKAADAALDAARVVSGIGSVEATTSRSHTRGCGVALLARMPAYVGIDLVAIERVGARHAAALLSAEERRVLALRGRLGPALAWGLKEAAAKAGGDPLRSFPTGLRIQQGLRDSLVVCDIAHGGMAFVAGWMSLRELLCVWVRGTTTLRAQAPGRALPRAMYHA